MERRTILVTLLYTVLCVALFLSALTIYGLSFHYKDTIRILNEALTIVLFLGICISLWFLAKYILAFRHEHLMRQEEYETVKQGRMKVHYEARLTQAEIEVRQADIALRNAETQAKQQEMYISLQRSNMEIEAMRIRLMIERQQASIYRVNAADSVYILEENNGFRQVVQGQIPQRVVSSRASVNEIAQVAQPYAPTFAQMQGLIASKDHLVLGYTANRPLYGTLEDHLLSMLFTGRPKMGKSTAILYYSAMFLKVGVLPIILDPQGSLQELEGILPYRNSMQGIHDFLPVLYREFEEREALWRKGRMLKPYSLVIIIDELPMIAAWEEDNVHKGDYSVSAMLRKVILELRKMLVYVIAAGQGFPHYILPTLSRENTSSRLIFPTTERYAKMAGLSEKHVKTLLPQIDASDKGTGILDISCEKEPHIINIPFTTVDDLVYQLNGNDFYRDLITKFSDPHIVDSQGKPYIEAPRQEQKAVYEQPLDNYEQHVYDACLQLIEEGEPITVNRVWNIIHGDKTRISTTIKKLVASGDLPTTD